MLKIEFDETRISSIISPSYKLLEKFNKKNNIKLNKFCVNVYFENDNTMGYYRYESNKKECIIYLNFETCLATKEKTRYYPNDRKMESVVLHEYCHFLDDIFKINESYNQQEFKKYKIKYLDITEEIAELLNLYIINPYFLKIYDIHRYKFFNNLFKSPTTCSKKEFFGIYNSWKPFTKSKFKKKYNLMINQKTNKVIIKK